MRNICMRAHIHLSSAPLFPCSPAVSPCHTDVAHTGPSWKLSECCTKVNFTLGFLPPPLFFARCCFHPTRCIVGPICLIIDDEGAISCLRLQDEEQRRLAAEELGNQNAVFHWFLWDSLKVRRLIPAFPSHHSLKLAVKRWQTPLQAQIINKCCLKKGRSYKQIFWWCGASASMSDFIWENKNIHQKIPSSPVASVGAGLFNIQSFFGGLMIVSLRSPLSVSLRHRSLSASSAGS